jgi:hypothetical protein
VLRWKRLRSMPIAGVALAYRARLERPQTYILDGHQYRLTVAADLVLR